MFKLKKYNFFEFSLLTYRIIPLWSILWTLIIVVSSAFPSIAVVLTGSFLDTAIEIFDGTRNYSDIWIPLSFFVLFVLFQYAFDIFNGFIIRKATMVLMKRIKYKVICFKASVLYEYYDNQEEALLLQRVTGEFEGKIKNSFECLMHILKIIVNFLGIAVIFVINDIWLMGSMILISTFILSIFSYKNAVFQYKIQKENFSGEVELYHSTYVLKDRSTVNERNLYQYSKEINAEWRNMQDELDDRMLRANSRVLLFRIVSKLINLSIAFFLILTIVYLASKQVISVGVVVALSSNLISLVTGLCTSFIGIVAQIAALGEYIKDYKVVNDFTTSDHFLKIEHTSPKIISSIEFLNVSFKYPASERYSLKNVSFKIEIGKKYAFVGPNGSGKTTIVKLLMKLYTDYTGEILVNHINLRDWSFNDILSSFGVCFQDFCKYQLSLKDNIDIGGGDTSDCIERDAQRILAIKTMHLEELVNQLPEKENTLLGKIDKNAQELSGGEWQRIALARLLMRNVNSYILDEPTASLDAKGECEVYKLFNELSNNKLLILISHRLGSIKCVDKIFVMNNGELVEEGTHEGLLNISGLYAEMYKSQSEWYK